MWLFKCIKGPFSESLSAVNALTNFALFHKYIFSRNDIFPNLSGFLNICNKFCLKILFFYKNKEIFSGFFWCFSKFSQLWIHLMFLWFLFQISHLEYKFQQAFKSFVVPTKVAPLSNPNFSCQNRFLIFISTASSNFFLYIKTEVIFGEGVQRVHTSTHTHTHTWTHVLILYPKNSHVWGVKEYDLIFVPVSTKSTKLYI